MTDMTQLERMAAGLLYDPGDLALVAARRAASDLCYAINVLPPSQVEERMSLFGRLFGAMGVDGHIEPSFHCDYGFHISTGANFYANYNCVMLDCAPITFGDDVMIGPNCAFYTACHPLDPDERISGLEYAKPIRVGHRVWIGGNTVVNPGVTIGDHAVIGSGSVVTHDIPPGVVAVGNPCRVLRPITPADRMVVPGHP